jgi:hypothetical protein
MEQIKNIEAAFIAVQEKHAEYAPLHAAYLKSMSAAGVYESTGQDDARANVALSMIDDGELTKKGIDRALSTGLIRKITVKKPDDLARAESALQKANAEYHRLCADAVLPFQFAKTRTPRGAATGENGDIGAAKKADVEAIIRGIDPGAEIAFDGRRVSGTLSNGATFDYDAYGQSYPGSIAKMMNRA